MDIVTIAQLVATDLKNDTHSYKSKGARFRALCKNKYAIWKASIQEVKNFEEFYIKIKALLGLEKTSKLPKYNSSSVVSDTTPKTPTEGDGIIYTLNQIENKVVDEDPYF